MFGLQNTFSTSSHLENRSRLHQESINTNFRNNNGYSSFFTSSRTFGPAATSTTLNAGRRIHDSLGLNDDEMDIGGFRRPNLSRMIRGRSSTMSSRLFTQPNIDRYNNHQTSLNGFIGANISRRGLDSITEFRNQNVERLSKDLSNIHGFDVTHISRRGLDYKPEFKFGFSSRQNGVENQSVAGSVYSVASAKAQFMNLLENLHHSILNMAPNLPIEAVRMEFDKVKEGLESINEMSIAPSIKEYDGASVISHSSRFLAPLVPDQITNMFDGDSIQLKSGKDVLRALDSRHSSQKTIRTTQFEKREVEHPSFVKKIKDISTDEEQEDEIFKKPKPISKWKRGPRTLTRKSPKVNKNVVSKIKEKAINLKQWYPIAVGTNLAFCGVDEEGAIVKTEAVKKRVNNRKIELINGLGCNLVGSPSASIVSALPEKVMSFLKNGLTDRWRVLQKELLNCQTVENGSKKRHSKSPQKRLKGSLSPKKRSNDKLSPRKMDDTSSPRSLEKKSSSPKKIVKKPPTPKKKTSSSKRQQKASKNNLQLTPQKNEKVSTPHTRSGRAVKPPAMFWLVSCSDEVTSSNTRRRYQKQAASDKKTEVDTTVLETPTKKSKKTIIATPVKKYARTPVKRGKQSRKVTKVATPKKSAKSRVESKAEEEEVTAVHSSTEDPKKEATSPRSRTKRKREVGDSDSTKRKRSKSEKKIEVEVESTVDDEEPPAKISKKGRGKSATKTQSPAPKTKKSPVQKKKASRKKTEKETSHHITETKELNEFDEDFEFQLDDIEIPEIANIKSKPQLTKSQLRVVCMETPPLKYFNNNLKLLRSTTPVRSPDWCISQRTDSEVKQFQRRREEAHKKKIQIEVKKTIVKEKTKNLAPSRDLKNVLDWVAEKTVRTPQWSSKVLQYVIPSRKQLEQEDEEDEEDKEIEFL